MSSQSAAAGISWEVVLPDTVSVLLPVDGGLRVDKNSPLLSETFEYPRNWQCACALIETERGGWLIYTEDAVQLNRWIVLQVERRPGQILLRFETRNGAPFDDKRTVESAEWRIQAWRGDWTAGASIYRNHIQRRFGLKDAARKAPEWAAQIRFVVILETDSLLLEPLANVCDPRQTLLYTPDWRSSPYDINYPEYTPTDRFLQFVRNAHRLGFRVMAHVNPYALDARHPLMPRFAPYQMRMEFHQQDHWYDTPQTNPPVRFAFINPASSAWRQEFVKRMQQLASATGIDALHLDTSLCMYNDRNGPIEGKTSMQGAVQLHRELQEALPQVALSGEGQNEVLAAWQHFAQYHAWGYNGQDQTFTNDKLLMAHPISTFLLSPYFKCYGHLGAPNAADYPQGWLAWTRAALPSGQIPTLKWPSINQLTNPPPTMAAQLRWAQVRQHLQLDAELRIDWPRNVLMRWNGANGAQAEARLLNDGVEFRTRTNESAAWQTQLRWVEGVYRWTGEGSLSGWHAWNGRTAVGLNPNTRTLWSPQEWPDIPHISDVTDGLTRASLAIADQVALLKVSLIEEDGLPSGATALWKRPARLGVTLRGSGETVADQMTLEHSTGAMAERRGDGYYMHPPWKELHADRTASLPRPGVGAVWVEWPLPAEADQTLVKATAQMQEGAAESDGVVFVVEARDRSGAVLRQAEAAASPGVDASLTLTLDGLPHAETLRVTVWPGPAGNASFDWAFLKRPHLHPIRPVTTAITASVSRMPDQLAPLVSSGTVTSAGPGNWRAAGEAPLFVVFGPPHTRAIAPSANLLAVAPLVISVNQAGQPQAIAEHMQPRVAEATINSVVKLARNAHPPENGILIHGWLVEAKGRALRIRARAGLGNNPQSDGVTFRIAVNGRPVAQHTVKPGDGWTLLEADLPPFDRFWLSLETEPGMTSNFDWASWADIHLETRPVP